MMGLKARSVVLLMSVLVVSMLVLNACGGSSGGETTIKGQVTKVDTGAKTFSMESGGKSYDFAMTSTSKGDINEVKEHMDRKKEIEVRYRGSSPPYEVTYAD